MRNNINYSDETYEKAHKLKYYEEMEMHVLNYICETWTMDRSDKRKIE
jgi:hypothetical protein